MEEQKKMNTMKVAMNIVVTVAAIGAFIGGLVIAFSNALPGHPITLIGVDGLKIIVGCLLAAVGGMYLWNKLPDSTGAPK